MSASMPSWRHATRVAGAAWVVSCMGSHLTGNVHAGRCGRDEARSMAASR